MTQEVKRSSVSFFFNITKTYSSKTSEQEPEFEVNYIANVIKFLSGKLNIPLTTTNGNVAYGTSKNVSL